VLTYTSVVAITSGSAPDTNIFVIDSGGKQVSWTTGDKDYVGEYTITVTATSGCSSEQLTYTVEIVEGCE